MCREMLLSMFMGASYACLLTVDDWRQRLLRARDARCDETPQESKLMMGFIAIAKSLGMCCPMEHKRFD